jgi:hypothetical protein
MALHFHLAGINNQNFLMRDEETGTYWQQITGLAIAGYLAGRRLILVSADELTFVLWKKDRPSGTVLNDVPQYASDYAPENWDVGRVEASPDANQLLSRFQGRSDIEAGQMPSIRESLAKL